MTYTTYTSYRHAAGLFLRALGLDGLGYVLKLVLFGIQAFGKWGRQDTGRSILLWLGETNLIAAEDEAVVSASDDDGAGVSVAGAIIEEDVVFKGVSVSSERFGFFAKEETDSGVVFHDVVAEEIIGILVTDGDAFTLVGDEFIVFKLSVLDSPADEHAVRFVARGFAVANDRVLGTTSGMEAQACIVIGYTIFNDDSVAELEADSIAIEVTNFAIPDCDVFAFEKIDASMAATVHGFAFGAIFVADDGNAFN